jgi:hypothetical protein
VCVCVARMVMNQREWQAASDPCPLSSITAYPPHIQSSHCQSYRASRRCRIIILLTRESERENCLVHFEHSESSNLYHQQSTKLPALYIANSKLLFASTRESSACLFSVCVGTSQQQQQQQQQQHHQPHHGLSRLENKPPLLHLRRG